jgi:hypothetical protein
MFCFKVNAKKSLKTKFHPRHQNFVVIHVLLQPKQIKSVEMRSKSVQQVQFQYSPPNFLAHNLLTNKHANLSNFQDTPAKKKLVTNPCHMSVLTIAIHLIAWKASTNSQGYSLNMLSHHNQPYV